MASVQRNAGSPFWTASIRVWVSDPLLPGGGKWKRTRKSTGVELRMPKEIAIVAAQELQRQAEDIYAGKAEDPEEFFKQSVARLMLASGIKNLGESRRWDEFSAAWLNDRRVSPRTREKYQSEIDRFTTFLGPRKSSPLRLLTEQDCSRWYASMIKSGLSNGTANQAVKTVRSIMNAARDRGLISGNPAALVSLDYAVGHERRPFTPLEVRTIFAHIEAHEVKEWRTACLLGLLYGLRLRDAIGRRFDEIQDGVLTFVPMKKRRKGKRVPLPLTGELLNLKGKGLITPSLAAIVNPSKVFSRILKDAKVIAVRSEARGKGKTQADVSFHSWRHTCNSWLANVGIDGRIRQLISDHDSPTENARYTKPDVETMRGAVEKLLEEMES